MTKLSMHERLPFDEATTPPRVSTGRAAAARRRSATSSPRRTSATARTATARWPTTSRSWPAHRPSCSGSPWSASGGGRSRSATSRRRSRSRASPSRSCSRWCARRSGTARRGARLGVNSTGFPFDSLMAVELNDDRTMNPLVNAGAIATTSLVPGDTADEKWERIRDGLSRFAGRELTMNEEVYASESATNLRNQGIAHLLESYGRLYFDPDQATDVYTRQCSLEVTVHDLAVMAATLANGGVNPMTGDVVIVPGGVPTGAGGDGHRRPLRAVGRLALRDRRCRARAASAAASSPCRPGKGGLATFSPPLDAAGNSVRGQLVTKYLAERLGLNLFASEVAGP